jgi:membrane associated rhomboid family serine protease
MTQYSTPSLKPGVQNILIISVLVYAAQIMPSAGFWLTAWGSLVPSLVFTQGQIWRLATYIFLHDPQGPWHLVFNMLALWMFGSEIESIWGTRRFLQFYLISGVGAGLLSFFTWNTPIIGASGAVLALLTVYAMYFPRRQVLMFFIFPMPVWLAVIIIGFISLAGSIGSAGGIAHLTHLGGIMVALVYVKGVQSAAWLSRRIYRQNTAVTNPEDNTVRNYDESQVDPILEKIHLHGMDSLTRQERNTLLRFSAESRKKRGKVIPFDFKKHSS